jgi:hypothetical protein
MMKWKDFKGIDSDLISRNYSGIRLEGPRKTTKTLSQDNQSPSRDLDTGPPEYGAGVLTTRPQSLGPTALGGSDISCLILRE